MPSAFSAKASALRSALTGTPCSVRSERSTCASIRFENDSRGGFRDAGRIKGGKSPLPLAVGYCRPRTHERSVAEGSRT